MFCNVSVEAMAYTLKNDVSQLTLALIFNIQILNFKFYENALGSWYERARGDKICQDKTLILTEVTIFRG